MSGVNRRGRYVAGAARGIAAMCLAGMMCAACDSLPNGARDGGSSKPDVFDLVRNIDLTSRSPQPTEAVRPNTDRPPRAQNYFGDAQASAGSGGGTSVPTSGGDGYDLNFENAAVTTVAKVILGDILNLTYIIDPRVQGNVSLASGQPVRRGDLLYVLENVLRANNIALVQDRTGYRLIPLAEAIGSGSVEVATRGRQQEPGYGITVVPLHYVSVAAAIKLFDSFATKPGIVRGDPTRNILLVQGTSAERMSAVETVLTFDVDWMRGQSVGVYPLRNAGPEPVITELEKIMGASEGGAAQNIVKFEPVTRLNAVMVVAGRPELLRMAATWISRLDRSDTVSSAVKVYRVKYGDARRLAAILNELFTGRQSSGLDEPANQLAPGSGLSASSSQFGQGASSSSSLGASSAGSQSSLSSTNAGFGGGLFQNQGQQQGGLGGAGQRFGAAGTGTAPGFGGQQQQGSNSLLGQTGTGSAGPPLLPGVRITADVTNNALLIYANQENYRIVERTLQQLDRPQLQVAIDATIAEITLNDNLQYGVQYFLTNPNTGTLSLLNQAAATTASTATAQTATTATNQAGTTAANSLLQLGPVTPGFNFLVGSLFDTRAILSALRTVSDVKVLSAPSVVVLDNQVATLLVGDQVPIQTQTATAVTAAGAPIVSSIDYRNTGVILRVRPRINVNGNVLLEVDQEISSVASTSSSTLTPTISQRKITSAIAVASGQTVLLAGLISDNQQRNRSNIPVLGEIDWIGDLFGNTTRSSARTELIIFIRPQIIRDGIDAHRVAEELRSKLRGTAESTKRPLIKLPNHNPASIIQ